MRVYDVVTKLIGPVEAIGDSREDQQRLSNLAELIDLIDELLQDVSYASRTADDYRASMKAIGEKAKTYLDGLSQSAATEGSGK